MGCNAIEDPHHVFVLCKAFEKLRDNASEELVKKTIQRIEATGLEEALQTSSKQLSYFSPIVPTHGHSIIPFII